MGLSTNTYTGFDQYSECMHWILTYVSVSTVVNLNEQDRAGKGIGIIFIFKPLNQELLSELYQSCEGWMEQKGIGIIYSGARKVCEPMNPHIFFVFFLLNWFHFYQVLGHRWRYDHILDEIYADIQKILKGSQTF